MSFDRVREIADAILLEGYLLYPYRASAIKNRYRWAFGVLAPQKWSEAGGSESWWMETQCLIEGDPQEFQLQGVLRFLQMQRRTVEKVEGEGVFSPVASLEVGERLMVPFEEGEIREVPFQAGKEPEEILFEVSEGSEGEELYHGGSLVGRVRRERWGIQGRISLEAESLGPRLSRLRIRVQNIGVPEDIAAGREEALRNACMSTHMILSLKGGEFVSLLDPPEWTKEAAESCKNVRSYPVLGGKEGSRDLLLVSPFILYDHPQIAPESPGDFFDATEIDELLVLRASTLTADERREAMATDARGAALLERVEALSAEAIGRLHGAIREGGGPLTGAGSPFRGAEPEGRFGREPDRALQRNPDDQREEVENIALLPPPGSRVRLRPGGRRTDAQDMLFVGCIATVEKVLQDIDGQGFLAVTMDDDPASDLHRWYGRFLYYYPDEVELLEP